MSGPWCGGAGDAHHITSPPEDGSGARRAMEVALKDAGLSSADIAYVNAHATSTPTGDLAEVNAIQSLFASASESRHDVFVSSTKGATGHLLGAAGAVEGAFTCLALHTGKLPPTLNLKDPVPPSVVESAGTEQLTGDNCSGEMQRQVSHVTQKGGLSMPVDGASHAVSNSFGFGGTNASLVFKRWTSM